MTCWFSARMNVNYFLCSNTTVNEKIYSNLSYYIIMLNSCTPMSTSSMTLCEVGVLTTMYVHVC